MQNSKKIRNIVSLALLLVMVACATVNAPLEWLANPKEVPRDVFGGWITVKYFPGSKDTGQLTELSGELIAISMDTVYIATEKLHAISRSNIQSARLAAYDSKADVVGLMVYLGALSTGSNGLFSGITFPMWIIGGIIAGRDQSYQPIIDYPKQEWNRFVPYARFPQGLPAGIQRNKIKMKLAGS